MQAWDVELDGELIDTVFYDSDCDADYVKRGLIDHDGYDSRIEVVKVVKTSIPHRTINQKAAKKWPPKS